MNDIRPTSSRGSARVNRYVEDGYNVTEYIFSDNTYMITKEKENHVFYYIKGKDYVTRGMYDKREFDRRMEDFNKSMDEWSNQSDEWSKKISENLNKAFGTINTTIPPFPDFPEFESPILIGESETVYSDSFFDIDDLSSSTDTNIHSPHNGRKSKNYHTSGNTGCLGCFFGTLLFLCIICIILYGMGVIGGNIVQFFKSLF